MLELRDSVRPLSPVSTNKDGSSESPFPEGNA